MINTDSILPLFPARQIMSSYTHNIPNKKLVEYHEYISINGGFPQHIVHYKIYNNQGQIEENMPNRIDVKA